MFPLDDTIALLTKHEKHLQIAPVLKRVWHGQVQLEDSFDTDTLGSFDRKTKRKISPKNCALKKAYLACEVSGLNQGIGSEGSFNGFAGMGNLNEEIIAFVDIKRNVELLAYSRKMVNLQPIRARDEKELQHQLSRFSKSQAWMMHSNNKSSNEVNKGLLDVEQITSLVESEAHWPVYLEPDFRAMNCPERQETISSAAADLVLRLKSACPSCTAPGFVAEKIELGLPCEICLAPTNQVKAKVAACRQCEYEERYEQEEQSASSFYCQYCNP